MRQHCLKLVLCFLTVMPLLVHQSCNKEEDIMEETMRAGVQNKTDEPIVFNVNEQTTNDEPTRTILGNMRQNPFTI